MAAAMHSAASRRRSFCFPVLEVSMLAAIVITPRAGAMKELPDLLQRRVVATDFAGNLVEEPEDAALGLLAEERRAGELVHFTGVKDVAGGGSHTLFMREDNTLWSSGLRMVADEGHEDHTPVQVIPSKLHPFCGHASYPDGFAAGARHSVVVKTDGSVWAWGKNAQGQLGLGDWTDRRIPALVNISKVAKVFAGQYTSFFLKQSGTLWGAGLNTHGHLGAGNRSKVESPTLILASKVSYVAAGKVHTLFLMDGGQVYGTGSNSNGQLLTLPTTSDIRGRVVPEALIDGDAVVDDVASVAAGLCDSFFLKRNGYLYGCGCYRKHRGGDLHVLEKVSSQVKGVAAGYLTITYRKEDGGVWAIGYVDHESHNDDGTCQASSGGADDKRLPCWEVLTRGTELFTAGDMVMAFPTWLQSFFSYTNGSMLGVGKNQHGQLGDGTTASSDFPPPISAMRPVVVPARRLPGGQSAVAPPEPPASLAPSIKIKDAQAGDCHSVFLREDNSLWSVGCNAHGQLGDGTKVDRVEQATMGSAATACLSPPAALFLGPSGSAFALGDVRLAWFVGRNDMGQAASGVLGDNAHFTMAVKRGKGGRLEPLAGLQHVVWSEDGATTHWLTDDGVVWAAGRSDSNESTAYLVPVLHDVKSMSMRSGGSWLIVFRNGTLWSTAGRALVSLLQFSDAASRATVNASFVYVTSSATHSLALDDQARVWVQGSNNAGQAGLGTMGGIIQEMTLLPNFGNVTQVAATNNASFFLKGDGTGWAAGRVGGDEKGSTPIDLGVSQGIKLSCGPVHCFVVTSAGTAIGFGDNSNGQLGGPGKSPMQVPAPPSTPAPTTEQPAPTVEPATTTAGSGNTSGAGAGTAGGGAGGGESSPSPSPGAAGSGVGTASTTTTTGTTPPLGVGGAGGGGGVGVGGPALGNNTILNAAGMEVLPTIDGVEKDEMNIIKIACLFVVLPLMCCCSMCCIVLLLPPSALAALGIPEDWADRMLGRQGTTE